MGNWRKSSHSFSNGNCVEAAGKWLKSSASYTEGNCAEVARDGAGVRVRDTADRGGPVLAFPAGAWTAFLARLKA